MNYPGKTKEEDNAEQKTPRASLKKKVKKKKMKVLCLFGAVTASLVSQ